MKMLIVPFIALILSFMFTGCYVGRPYDPYYNSRVYKYKYRHHRHWDRDHDRDDRDYGYRRY
jgi:hypothetical protein